MKHSVFDLSGKTALVTGGSKGIGLGIARALGVHGAMVAIASRDSEEGRRAEESLLEAGVDAIYIKADVTKKNEVDHLIDTIVSRFGSLHILVNNAGMNIRKPLVEIEERDWDKVLDVNLKGVFLVGQAAAKQMINQEYGKIINISSILGSVALPNQTSYAASKGGINQLTKVWAEELAPHHITVNAIGPGYIRTPMTEGWLTDADRLQGIVKSTMQNRIGELSDLIGPIVFLASEASAYVTGQIIHVDGGWTAR